MPQPARVAAIIRSIEKGSDLTAAVVLGSDRFLVDFLTDVELETIRQAWARTRYHDDVVVLKQRESDLAYLERACAVSRSWQLKTHNPSIAETPPAASSGQPRSAPGPMPVNHAAAPTLEQRAAAFKAT